jgi:hypothetical protein
MNQRNEFEYRPQFKRLLNLVEQGAELEHLQAVYNEPADELVVFLFPGVECTVAFDVDDVMYLLIDSVSQEVVGFQFDDFMNQAVLERPQLLALALLAGIDERQVEQARARIGEERSRKAAVQSALRELLAASWVPN